MGLYKLEAPSIPPPWYPFFLHEPQPGLPCGPHTQDTPMQATPSAAGKGGPHILGQSMGPVLPL